MAESNEPGDWITDNGAGQSEGGISGDSGSTREFEQPNLGAEPKKRRGRPPKSDGRTADAGERAGERTSKNKTRAKLDLALVASYLQAGHSIAAKVAKKPILEIDNTEADNLARAIQGVLDQYDIRVDPKVAAWGNLAVTCAAIYGTRFVLYQQMQANSKMKDIN